MSNSYHTRTNQRVRKVIETIIQGLPDGHELKSNFICSIINQNKKWCYNCKSIGILLRDIPELDRTETGWKVKRRAE